MKKKTRKELFKLRIQIDALQKQISVLLNARTPTSWQERTRRTDTPLMEMIHKDPAPVSWGFSRTPEMRTAQQWQDLRESDRKYREERERIWATKPLRAEDV